MMPTVEIIGVHPVPDGAAELGPVVLVEARVHQRDGRFDVGHFGQSEGDTLGPNDQVAYDEVFLSGDGQTVLAHDLRDVEEGDLRPAFFLHLYDGSRPILTSYGSVQPPATTPMPDRLARLVEYVPVD